MKASEIRRRFPQASQGVLALNCDPATVTRKEKRRFWTQEEIAQIMRAYSDPRGVDLEPLAKELGRSPAAVACKAEELGVSSRRGKQIRTAACRDASSAAQKEVSARPGVQEKRVEAVKKAFRKNGHPRGFLGGKHTDEAKQKIREANERARKNPNHKFNSPEYRQELSDRFTKMAAERNPENCYSRTKAGWVQCGGKRFYARSRWEANYGRYLEWLKSHGEIVDWEHEPKTFWFEKILRGTRSYLPDFCVTVRPGFEEYHEVKGWMDPKSRTKIARMGRYHPDVVLVVIGAPWFRKNSKMLCRIVPGWEVAPPPKRKPKK